MQTPDLADEQLPARGEQLARTGVAGSAKSPRLEVSFSERDRARIAVGVARYLAENPVTSTGVSQHKGWAQLRLGKVGERETDQDYCCS